MKSDKGSGLTISSLVSAAVPDDAVNLSRGVLFLFYFSIYLTSGLILCGHDYAFSFLMTLGNPVRSQPIDTSGVRRVILIVVVKAVCFRARHRAMW